MIAGEGVSVVPEVIAGEGVSSDPDHDAMEIDCVHDMIDMIVSPRAALAVSLASQLACYSAEKRRFGSASRLVQKVWVRAHSRWCQRVHM